MSLISYLWRLPALWLGATLAGGALVRLPAMQGDADAGRRIADIVTIALGEYAEGVVDGRVVREEERHEATLLLDEARQAAALLPAALLPSVLPPLHRLEAGVRDLQPARELQAVLAALRRELERGLGIALDPLPPEPPSLSRGAAIYRQHCAGCHGAAGAGDGPMAAGLKPPPADLAERAARAGASPMEYFRKINVGVAGTAMPGFAAQLDLQDRWAVALYATLLRHPAPARERGRARWDDRCPDCAVELSDFATTAGSSDDSLAALVVARTGVGPDDPALWDLVAYARAAAAREHLGGDAALAHLRAVRRSNSLVAEALRLAEVGDLAAAERRALDAYLAFEAIESAVRARDRGSVARLERAFTRLRGALAARDRAGEWRAAGSAVHAALDAVATRTDARLSTPALFAQALVIMLREGLEAILIVGALSAVLAKAGVPQRRREVGWGVVAALGASLLTAAGFVTVFRVAPAQQEALEGATLLLAAVVLFWVSYWLVSKIEQRKWMAFVRSQVGKAIANRRAWALAGVAFLAVYREGVETVLFYAALVASADARGVVSGIVPGMAVGVAGLGLVYYLMQRYGVRLPLRPFFATTSAVLYLMAFSFAGQGVAELQSAGLVAVTPLDWLPALPALGIFPTVQTFVGQLVLAAALAGALLWVFGLSRGGRKVEAPA